jgi:hypothetical protein
MIADYADAIEFLLQRFNLSQTGRFQIQHNCRWTVLGSSVSEFIY